MALGIVLFLVLFLLLISVYTITEGSRGIVLRLGRLVEIGEDRKPLVILPGLHVKTPFIDQIRIFDTRLQTLDIQSSRIVTKEKKDVIVDYYVKWRIEDLARYYTSTSGNQINAENLLEQQLNTSLRAAFGRRTISDLVTSERDDVMQMLRQKAENQANQLGIHVVDVRIKGIELPPNTSNAIYQRMRADMQKIANHHRADGQAEALNIKATADATVTVTLAKANSAAQMLRATSLGEAARIYREAYGVDPSFYAFYQSLQAYQDSFNTKKDVLVLDLQSKFFEYFRSSFQKRDGVTQ